MSSQSAIVACITWNAISSAVVREASRLISQAEHQNDRDIHSFDKLLHDVIS